MSGPGEKKATYAKMNEGEHLAIESNEVPAITKYQRNIGDKMKYDEGLSMLRSVFYWNGTIFKEVIFGWDVWIFFLIYAGFTLWMRFQPDLWATVLGGKSMDLKQMGALTVFLLVFFNGHCYVRFLAQYAKNMQGLQALRDFEITIFSMTKNKKTAYHASRYLQAAHVLGWMHLNEEHQSGEIAEINYEFLQDAGLLTKNEIQHLIDRPAISRMTSRPAMVVCRWCLEMVTVSERAGEIIGGGTADSLRSACRSISDAICDIYDFRGCYIPFQYYHALNVCAFLFLVSSSFVAAMNSVAKNDYAEQFVTFAFGVFVICALRKMSVSMMFAYGTDVCDLPAAKFINTALQDHFALSMDTFKPAEQPRVPVLRPGLKST